VLDSDQIVDAFVARLAVWFPADIAAINIQLLEDGTLKKRAKISDRELLLKQAEMNRAVVALNLAFVGDLYRQRYIEASDGWDADNLEGD
jgi:hypothetical protein